MMSGLQTTTDVSPNSFYFILLSSGDNRQPVRGGGHVVGDGGCVEMVAVVVGVGGAIVSVYK